MVMRLVVVVRMVVREIGDCLVTCATENSKIHFSVLVLSIFP